MSPLRLRPAAPRVSRLTRGPIVLGSAVAAVLGYAIAGWLARVATYAERVEEEQYCGPPEEHASSPDVVLPVQARPATAGTVLPPAVAGSTA